MNFKNSNKFILVILLSKVEAKTKLRKKLVKIKIVYYMLSDILLQKVCLMSILNGY